MFKKLKGIIKYLYVFIITFKGLKSENFLDYEDTINYCIANNLSIIRWGDGETDILRGIDIYYQYSTENLIRDLYLIIHEYNNNDNPKFLFCLPIRYLSMTIPQLIYKRMWGFWTNTRLLYKKSFNKNKKYGDAFLFAQGRETSYSKLWENKNVKYIIFVHSNINSYYKFLNNYRDKTTFFINIPKKNAYSEIDNIEKEIIKIIERNIANINEFRVLVSAGPAGKVLIYRLLKYGIIAYDTGHCWDEPLVVI